MDWWTNKRLGVTEKVDPIIYKLAEFRSLYFDTPVQTMQTKGYDFMPDLSTVVNMFFGADNNKVLYALIILVTLDYITGVCVAIKDKKLSSSIGAKGIINKVVIFIMVSLSHVVDSYLLSSGVALERITILFYCANEAIRFLYKGIIIKHNKTEPTYTKTSLFLCEKRRFFMARTEKGVVTTI